MLLARLFLIFAMVVLAEEPKPADLIKPTNSTLAAYWKSQSDIKGLDIQYLQARAQLDAKGQAAQAAMEKSCQEHSQTLDLAALQQGDVKCRSVEKLK